jgi:hypothetical protein
MGMRRMTFEIPEDMAERFSAEVPADEQLRVVVTAIRRRITPSWTDEELEAACEAANNDPALNAFIDEWQAFSDPIEEPWDEPAAR